MKILRKTMPILSAVLLFVSCSKDANPTVTPEEPSFGEGKQEVVFSFSAADMDNPQGIIPLNTATRAGEPPMETDLTNLRVLQFDEQNAAAKLIFNEYFTASQLTTEPSGAKKLYASLYEKAKTCIYVIANVDAARLAKLDNTLTLGDFEKMAIDFTSEKDITSNGSALPMIGSAKCSTTAATSVTISLTRLVSKIAFTCNVQTVSGETFEIKRIQLLDAASKVAVSAPAVPTAQSGLSPVASSDNFLDYPECPVAEADKSSVTHTWYMPENLRGVVAGLTEKTKGGTNVPAYSTCIEVSGDYTKNGQLEDVTYRIYPGANSSTDFNLIRNNAYTIKATILGKNDNDIRVIVEKGIPAGKYDDGAWE